MLYLFIASGTDNPVSCVAAKTYFLNVHNNDSLASGAGPFVIPAIWHST